jgi:hypothetical protein
LLIVGYLLPLFSFVVITVIVAISVAVAAADFLLIVGYCLCPCHYYCRWSLCPHHAAAALMKMGAFLGFWFVSVL